MAWPLRRVLAKGVLINTTWNPLGSFRLFSWRLWPFAGLLLSNKAFLRVVVRRGGLCVGKMFLKKRKERENKAWGWELMVFLTSVWNDIIAGEGLLTVIHRESQMNHSADWKKKIKYHNMTLKRTWQSFIRPANGHWLLKLYWSAFINIQKSIIMIIIITLFI